LPITVVIPCAFYSPFTFTLSKVTPESGCTRRQWYGNAGPGFGDDGTFTCINCNGAGVGIPCSEGWSIEARMFPTFCRCEIKWSLLLGYTECHTVSPGVNRYIQIGGLIGGGFDGPIPLTVLSCSPFILAGQNHARCPPQTVEGFFCTTCEGDASTYHQMTTSCTNCDGTLVQAEIGSP
jgi:hypothetical protein